MVFLRRCNLFSVPDGPRDTVALLFTFVEMKYALVLCSKKFLAYYLFSVGGSDQVTVLL